jgi:thiamine-phosphate pyrophosphorylase
MKDLILTEGARRALGRSVELAQKLASPVVTPAHLLCSLLDEESPAQEFLEQRSVDRWAVHAAGLLLELPEEEDPVQAALVSAVMDALGESAKDRKPAESRELDAAIVFAQRLAARAGSYVEISSLHLVAGLSQGGSLLADLLRQHGVTVESLGFGSSRVGEEDMAEPMAVEFQIELEEAQSDRVDTLRILDAAANRAREGLRVVEDFVRFTLDDAHLSRQLKEVRHQLSSVMAGLDTGSLIQSRDTLGDVGTAISTRQEMSRASLLDVAKAGLKRAQEAARTLEEFSKVIAKSVEPDQVPLPEQFARIRYGLYTLEKAVLTAADSNCQLDGRPLYLLLTVESCQLDWETVLRESITGGVGVVQVREKSMSDRELLAHLRRAREVTRESGTLLIMNDRPDLTVLAECDGVHVGQDELSVKDVRRIVGPDRLVGVSTHSIEQARQAVLEGAGYLGIGPVFPSRTKQFDEFAGLEFVREVSDEISLPAFPIGGIGEANLGQVLEAGASRVSVSGEICRAMDPRAVAAALAAKLSNR